VEMGVRRPWGRAREREAGAVAVAVDREEM
jgi:hypothetical protein